MKSKNPTEEQRSNLILPTPLLFDDTLNNNSSTTTLDSSSSYYSTNNNSTPGLLSDLWQTQLALWTFTLSTVLTSLWQKRVRFRSLLYAFAAVCGTAVLSWVLACLVVVAHVFSVDFFSSYVDNNSDADEGWVSPRLLRSMSVSSNSSAGFRSRPSSGACSPVCVNKHHPVFWERKMSMEQNYYGSISSSRC